MTTSTSPVEVTALARTPEGEVFPGHPPGSPLVVRQNRLWARTRGGDRAITDIWADAAPERGLHVVSEQALLGNLRRFRQLFARAFVNKTTVCWAVKALPVRGVIAAAAPSGCGADVGSHQELAMALAAGIDPQDIVCTGVAKLDSELAAIVDCGATSVLDNLDEARALNGISERAHKVTPIAVRVNPGVDVPTHDMIATGAIGSKFGIPISQAEAFIDRLSQFRHLELTTIHMHLGAHFYDVDPAGFAAAIEREAELVHRLRRSRPLTRIDIGGGFRFPFLSPEQAAQMGLSKGLNNAQHPLVTQPDLLARSMDILQQRVRNIEPEVEILAEPGTAIVAGATFSLGQVIGVRDLTRITSSLDGRSVDAGWILSTASTAEFLLKTAVPNLLYQTCVADRAEESDFAAGVAGPLCFAGDVLSPPGTYLRMGRPVRGDVVCFANTGAYIGCGFNFHNLPRFAIAILHSDGALNLVRRAEPHDPMAALDVG